MGIDSILLLGTGQVVYLYIENNKKASSDQKVRAILPRSL